VICTVIRFWLNGATGESATDEIIFIIFFCQSAIFVVFYFGKTVQITG
jgi:hypothetical protein